MNLKDPTLLREQCLINGQWMGAELTISVTNPATGAHGCKTALVEGSSPLEQIQLLPRGARRGTCRQAQMRQGRSGHRSASVKLI